MELLKKFLISSEMTQVELAEAFGVSQATVSDWKQGKTFPSATRFDRVSRVTGIPVSKLEQALLEKEYAA